jgi:hypothetical protein
MSRVYIIYTTIREKINHIRCKIPYNAAFTRRFCSATGESYDTSSKLQIVNTLSSSFMAASSNISASSADMPNISCNCETSNEALFSQNILKLFSCLTLDSDRKRDRSSINFGQQLEPLLPVHPTLLIYPAPGLHVTISSRFRVTRNWSIHL